MSRFPALLPEQERALFEIVKAFRKHEMEGRPVIVVTEIGYPRLILSMGEESPHVDADLDTLRVLDDAGYVSFTETPQTAGDGSQAVPPTLILKRLASDYYDWFHLNAWYKGIVDRWYVLAPDSRSAIVGVVASTIVYLLLPLLASAARAFLEFLAPLFAQK